MRRAAKKDANHNPIAQYLRSRGWFVEDTHRQSDGFPDMIAAKLGWSCLIEAKDGDKDLTPKEIAFATRYRGPLITAYSPEDAEQKLESEFQYCWTLMLRGRD